jgi:hypothetical protein
MAEFIRLRCKECGHTVERKKHCAYTGIEHGRGWVYICECRGEMEVVDIISDSPFLCDILDDVPPEALVPWKVFKKTERYQDGDKPIWGKSVLDQIREANKALDEKFFDTMAAAGKRLDMEEVPRGERVLKMWTFNDDSEIS